MKTKLTKENWEDAFNNELVDWNSPRFIQSVNPVRDTKAFIKRLLDDIPGQMTKEDRDIILEMFEIARCEGLETNAMCDLVSRKQFLEESFSQDDEKTLKPKK